MPYFLSPPKIKILFNPAAYLGGGRDFGPFPSATPPGALHISSLANLTSDARGKPVGGMQLRDFFTVMRTGKDFDGLHPTFGPSGPIGRFSTTCLTMTQAITNT
jgi:hypothetical protein